VGTIDEAAMEDGLRQLIGGEILFVRTTPSRTYVFKHALIRDAAYESILRRQRRAYHGQVAAVLMEGFPETRDKQPEVLAYHLTEAGAGLAAIEYWRRAAQRAIERSGN